VVFVLKGWQTTILPHHTAGFFSAKGQLAFRAIRIYHTGKGVPYGNCPN
jgi:hypothetical protein